MTKFVYKLCFLFLLFAYSDAVVAPSPSPPPASPSTAAVVLDIDLQGLNRSNVDEKALCNEILSFTNVTQTTQNTDWNSDLGSSSCGPGTAKLEGCKCGGFLWHYGVCAQGLSCSGASGENRCVRNSGLCEPCAVNGRDCESDLYCHSPGLCMEFWGSECGTSEEKDKNSDDKIDLASTEYISVHSLTQIYESMCKVIVPLEDEEFILRGTEQQPGEGCSFWSSWTHCSSGYACRCTTNENDCRCIPTECSCSEADKTDKNSYNCHVKNCQVGSCSCDDFCKPCSSESDPITSEMHAAESLEESITVNMSTLSVVVDVDDSAGGILRSSIVSNSDKISNFLIFNGVAEQVLGLTLSTATPPSLPPPPSPPSNPPSPPTNPPPKQTKSNSGTVVGIVAGSVVGAGLALLIVLVLIV